MKYTILTQWKTLDGQYHSATVDKSNYDSAFGELHGKVKPLMNDSNVACFYLSMIDETGTIQQHVEWVREVEAANAE